MQYSLIQRIFIVETYIRNRMTSVPFPRVSFPSKSSTSGSRRKLFPTPIVTCGQVILHTWWGNLRPLSFPCVSVLFSVELPVLWYSLFVWKISHSTEIIYKCLIKFAKKITRKKYEANLGYYITNSRIAQYSEQVTDYTEELGFAVRRGRTYPPPPWGPPNLLAPFSVGSHENLLRATPPKIKGGGALKCYIVHPLRFPFNVTLWFMQATLYSLDGEITTRLRYAKFKQSAANIFLRLADTRRI